MGARRTKNRWNSVKEYSLFRKGVFNNFEVQRKCLLLQKKEVISEIVKRCEFIKSSLPSDLLRKKLREVINVDVREGEAKLKNDLGILRCHSSKSAQSISSKSIRSRLRSSNSDLHGSKNANYNKSVPNYIITSKVNPYSPVSMLRVPNKGEFAVSVAGSPLQVSHPGSDTASINIPLKNGNIMSVLPKPGLNTNIIQENLEPSVKTQLETLRNAISKILQCPDSPT